MTEIGKKLKDELSRLPAEDRAELAHFLLTSLDPEEDSEDPTVWDAELDRRAAEIKSGVAVGEPAAAVFAALRSRYGPGSEPGWFDTALMDRCATEADDTVTLEEVHAALANIPGSLTDDFLAERDDD